MPPISEKPIPAVSFENPSKTLSSLFHLSQNLPFLKRLHARILVHGLHPSVLFGSKLANAYIELGSLADARQAFEQIPLKNPHSWNTIISGYSKSKRFFEVLCLYTRMRGESFPPDSFNLVFAIKACAGECLLAHGKSVHSDAVKVGLDLDPFVGPELVSFYADLSCLDDARKLFDGIPERNPVAWGALINGYVKFSMEIEAFGLFRQMRELGLQVDAFTALGLVRACGNVCAGREGKMLHGYCVKCELLNSNVCLRTAIVGMYTKCGLLNSSQKLFDEIPEKDVVLWSAVVGGFAQNGKALQALSFFRRMLKDGIVPNMVTFASVLLACSHCGALRQGKSVHGYIVRNGVELDVVTYTAFVDMYAKCGYIMAAHKIFNQMPYHNVFSWSAMINGFGMHGLCTEAIALFNRMQSEGQIPNSVTFVTVLSACGHSGRVKEGWDLFNSISRDYGITPREEHYACMVDLLGRVGQFEEALSFIERMPMEPGAAIWGALLGACAIHKRVELAEMVAKKLFLIEASQPDVYVQLSNVYARVEKWDKVKKVRMMMHEKGLKKNTGFSLIEIDRRFRTFTASDRLACVN
ncbi:hypothetical protein AAC387_Pa02g0575 [Persea americana]